MRRLMLLAALLAAMALSAPAQDRILLQSELAEIDSILKVIDELEPIRSLVLDEGGRFSSKDVATLIALADLAEIFGADDLAAEARMLAVLARRAGGDRQEQETVAEESLLVSGVTPPFDAVSFRRMINITATLGVTSFALSAVFHYLAEQTYERYMNPLYTSPEFFQQFRTYDLLSVSLGAASLVTLGVGVPLAFAAPALWSADTSVPPAQPIYTAEERRERLEQLLVRRARVTEAIRLLPKREPLREAITTWSMVAGGVGFIASVASFYVADSFYGQYLDAETTADAQSFGNWVRLFDVAGGISGVVAGVGLATAAGVEIFTSNRNELEAQLKSINEQIITLRLAKPLRDAVIEAPATDGAAERAGL